MPKSTTHDPMCPEPHCDYGEPEGQCYGYGECSHHCQCSLIAKVRADERKQAEARVETLRVSPGLITIFAAASKAAGHTWTSQL